MTGPDELLRQSDYPLVKYYRVSGAGDFDRVTITWERGVEVQRLTLAELAARERGETIWPEVRAEWLTYGEYAARVRASLEGDETVRAAMIHERRALAVQVDDLLRAEAAGRRAGRPQLPDAERDELHEGQARRWREIETIERGENFAE